MTDTTTAPAAPATIDDINLLYRRIESLEATIKAQAAVVVQPVVTVVEQQPKTACAAFRAWQATQCAAVKTWDLTKCAANAITGLRTMLFFVTAGGLSLAQELQAIDLTPVVKMVFPNATDVTPAQIGVLLSVAGILLRLVTKSPAFQRWRHAASGNGRVDEPAA